MSKSPKLYLQIGEKVYFVLREYSNSNALKIQFSIPHVCLGVVRDIQLNHIAIEYKDLNKSRHFFISASTIYKTYKAAKNAAIREAKSSITSHLNVIEKAKKKKDILKIILATVKSMDEKDVLGSERLIERYEDNPFSLENKLPVPEKLYYLTDNIPSLHLAKGSKVWKCNNGDYYLAMPSRPFIHMVLNEVLIKPYLKEYPEESILEPL